MIYVVPDLLEEIFLGLPLKSILRFKTVSKQWRSILESKSFAERRLNVEKKEKILAVGDRTELGFEGEEEIQMVYLHCDIDATRPSLTCEGLVCIPAPGWINVLNPSTRQLRRFPCSPNHHVPSDRIRFQFRDELYLTSFPGNWEMGFGRDKFNGSYKVVRMCFSPVEKCEVLDVETGEWSELNPPPNDIDVGRKSRFGILALDLHTLEFHNVSVPSTCCTMSAQMVNLDDRLAITKTNGAPEWELEILSLMDVDKEIWSKTYSITLASIIINHPWESSWFTVLTVSKLGNLVFCDNHKRLFKYNTETNEICCLSSDISVISPYLEDLVPLRLDSGHDHRDYKIRTSSCGLFSKHPEAGLFKEIITFRFVFATLVLVGYQYYRSLKFK
ncbi:F-box-like domain superfamily [Arabidopsis thaliana x Arabidopsis arenosa]|uniref:F-box and associated interaction domains-containing protein n=3 Tax=Arabidopsis TaxID=3701 RepID=F4IR26_ARATH|nr:F-box and associated interaction domains-containing protein [Arabidopsis thaliana]KAG7639548.1 F-box-like domain superfamily [Arabidopsis thaliana x Arabidopsis arenosa]KAG7644137.1 F-box-like domain superfamily [Arabidopsis suecica]AAB64309.2 putative myb-related transcription factor [Arabidopsis thaliana]AAM14936.1 putative myb-related transcription factor [Arabidopsis thaliana]AEC10245.1 F-box and associated interaction domains-containing protein [Arabidopsis thaliana]|eukprot:NP_181856.1 F-box and associated interaction domains-containing protein [Arabidopsis thaliana]